MANHVKVLQEWLRQVQGRLDYHAGRSLHGPNPATVAERDALTAAISALTVDDAFVRRVLAALIHERGTYEGEVPVTEDDIRAALQAAIHGESHD